MSGDPITAIDVAGWLDHLHRTGETLHVIVNGQDVTKWCFRAAMDPDGVHGTAWRYARNAEGHAYIDPTTGTTAIETHTGEMRIEPGGPIA